MLQKHRANRQSGDFFVQSRRIPAFEPWPGFCIPMLNTSNMKTRILAAAFALMSAGAFAGAANNDHGDKYCAKMKDGKMVVMHKGSPITADATLDNGATVKPDGTVLMKDGTNMILSDGECINKDGSSIKKNTDKDHK